MERLAQVAQRLREVREAHQRFLALFAVEVALVEPGIARVAADVSNSDDDDATDDPDVPYWCSEDGADGSDGPSPLDWQ